MASEIISKHTTKKHIIVCNVYSRKSLHRTKHKGYTSLAPITTWHRFHLQFIERVARLGWMAGHFVRLCCSNSSLVLSGADHHISTLHWCILCVYWNYFRHQILPEQFCLYRTLRDVTYQRYKVSSMIATISCFISIYQT